MALRPFSWSPTGWFQIGYAASFQSAQPHPYGTSERIVAYRGEAVNSMFCAHCPHLGAHIGHGRPGRWRLCRLSLSRVEMERRGGQRRDPVPRQTQRVEAVAKVAGHRTAWQRLPVNDPDGGPPTWAMPDIFESFPQFETNPDSYYEPFVMTAGPEPVHPQLVAENAPDSVHFQHVHRATVTPVALDWNPTDLSGSS